MAVPSFSGLKDWFSTQTAIDKLALMMAFNAFPLAMQSVNGIMIFLGCILLTAWTKRENHQHQERLSNLGPGGA